MGELAERLIAIWQQIRPQIETKLLNYDAKMKQAYQMKQSLAELGVEHIF